MNDLFIYECCKNVFIKDPWKSVLRTGMCLSYEMLKYYCVYIWCLNVYLVFDIFTRFWFKVIIICSSFNVLNWLMYMWYKKKYVFSFISGVFYVNAPPPEYAPSFDDRVYCLSFLHIDVLIKILKAFSV